MKKLLLAAAAAGITACGGGASTVGSGGGLCGTELPDSSAVGLRGTLTLPSTVSPTARGELELFNTGREPRRVMPRAGGVVMAAAVDGDGRVKTHGPTDGSIQADVVVPPGGRVRIPVAFLPYACGRAGQHLESGTRVFVAVLRFPDGSQFASDRASGSWRG